MSERSRLRLFVLRVLVLSLLATLFGRVWYLQVLAGDQYQRAAADNQLRDIVTPAPRGLVLDAMGRPLVRNRTALVVSVDRIKLLRQPDGGKAVLERLAKVLGVSYASLHQRIQLCGKGVQRPCWNGSPYQPIPVSDRAETRMALQIMERREEFDGVTAEVQAVREYPQPSKALASHLLGYIGPITDEELARLSADEKEARRRDTVGRAGLERQYDEWLRGKPGIRTVAVDHVGAITAVVDETPPEAGATVVTSLDSGVQSIVEKALEGAVRNARSQGKKGDSAAGVVLDAQTGHVVAMASYPTYRPDVFVGGISQKAYDTLNDEKNGFPLLDRAVLGQYAPGSTFKLVSTAGLIHDGTAGLGDSFLCDSSYTVGGQTFRNFEGESFGYINWHTTLVKSCDTVYYRLAHLDWQRDQRLITQKKKPVEGVQAMARAFGLGKVTGIDLPSESPGRIEDRAFKRQFWEDYLRDVSCRDAKQQPKGSFLQRLGEENCKYGYLYNPGDQLNFDIGQGTVLTTPLQVATAYAALVNGGKVFSPRVAKALIAADGKLLRKVDAPVRGRVPVRPEVLDYIRNAMYDVPKSGTAQAAFAGWPFGTIAVGGKTGTAEVQGKNDTAWFASFAGPPGQPARYVAVVMVTQGGQGGRVAAPAVRQIWAGMFGVDGQKPAVPGGRPPDALPTVEPDGTVVPPKVAR